MENEVIQPIEEVVVEETTNAVTDVVTTSTPKTNRGLVIGLGVVATLGVGYGCYRLGRWIFNKVKAKKASNTSDEESETNN